MGHNLDNNGLAAHNLRDILIGTVDGLYRRSTAIYHEARALLSMLEQDQRTPLGFDPRDLEHLRRKLRCIVKAHGGEKA